MEDFISWNLQFIYDDKFLSILISSLYKNLQKWIWLKICFDMSFLSMFMTIFADLKFGNYFWETVHVIAGLKFWLDFGEI